MDKSEIKRLINKINYQRDGLTAESTFTTEECDYLKDLIVSEMASDQDMIKPDFDLIPVDNTERVTEDI